MSTRQNQRNPVFSLPGFPVIAYVAIAVWAITFVTVLDHSWRSKWSAVLAWALLLLFGLAIVIPTVRAMKLQITARKVALEAHQQWQRMLSAHEYLLVQPGELAPVERDYFDALQPQLESHGFRHLADLRNATAGPLWPKERHVHRIMLSAAGAVRATIDQQVNQAADGTVACSDKRLLLTTELSDGRFVVSRSLRDSDADNASTSADDQSPSPQPIALYDLSPNLPISEMLESHDRRVAQLAGSDEDPRPVQLATVEDVISTIRRMQALYNQQARAVDLTDHVERAALRDRRKAKLLRLVSSELEKLQSCPQCGYNLTGNTTGTCPECAAPCPHP